MGGDGLPGDESQIPGDEFSPSRLVSPIPVSEKMEEAPIYLDYNGTTPLDPAVAAAMLPYLQGRFGNPSSGHWFGVKEKEAVAGARADVALLIGADPAEISFTSGGTESVNWAIKGCCSHLPPGKGRHLVVSSVEHVVVLECAKFLKDKEGFEVTYVPCDAEGRVSPADVEAALRPETVLVSIMHANNETGTLNDIAAMARACRAKGILFHTDASQSVGKVRVDVKALQEVDLLTIAGHKLYAPAGIGALFVRADVRARLGTFMHGAGQEGGQRAGTESVILVVALGAACRVAALDQDQRMAALAATRDLLWSELSSGVPGLILNGSPEHRLPNTLNVSFPHLPSSRLLAALSKDVAASAGSACHADRSCSSSLLHKVYEP